MERGGSQWWPRGCRKSIQRGWLIRHGFKPVAGRLVGASQTLICKIRNGFGGHQKERRAEDPPHGEGQGEGNQWGAVWRWWEGNTKSGNIIQDVNLDHMYRAVLGVGLNQALKDTPEGLAKLHGLKGSEGKGVGIDSVKGEVHNSTCMALMLWHHTKGTDSEIGKMLDGLKGKDHPLAMLNHL